MEDCVLWVAKMLPERTPEQLRQLQFHWGNPPPAADPSILTINVLHLGIRVRKDEAAQYQRPSMYQRTLKYMVTSKPTRRSTNSGLVHIVLLLLLHSNFLVGADYSAVSPWLPTGIISTVPGVKTHGHNTAPFNSATSCAIYASRAYR